MMLGTDATLPLTEAFTALSSGFSGERYPDAATRTDRLMRLERVIREARKPIAQAISADFGGRSLDETELLEIFPTLAAIRHARSHVKRWMRVERRPTSILFWPGRSVLIPQPLGVVGVVVPWNYPLLLGASPLAGALAAGNRVLLKPSELAPQTAMLLAELLAKAFDPSEVSVATGGVEVGRAFVKLPFDHLVFTGSTAVGRSVMRDAAENLTPVTLELGGKSPALVMPGYGLDHAAERIIVGKCLNAGQTCIAPDYVLIPSGTAPEFLRHLRRWCQRLYPNILTNPDYTSIVSDRHFSRLAGYLAEAADKGAEIFPLAGDGVKPDAVTRRFPPTALLNPPDHCKVLQDEIFGPVLPILEYADVDHALAYINVRPRPLAMYLFDQDRSRVDRVLRQTIAGGVTLNDTILHIVQAELPFGGVGPSGMGSYHGKAGFDAFSKLKPVFYQSSWNAMSLFRPPYTERFRALVRLITR
jgi:coniferyl-aldehyde dehydrogenase